MRKFAFILLIAGLLVQSCGESTKGETEGQKLGVVHLKPTGALGAMADFEEGLLLLHSFQYEDAREAFERARAIDPQMSMALWGEAMTHNHPIWREQDYIEARIVIDSLALIDTQLTGLETGFIAAINVLYAPGVEKATRDQNYLEAMAALSEKYPDSEDAGAFHALALMGAIENGRDKDAYAKAAAVAKAVVVKNPEHPGALHYFIHASDDPVNAPAAIEEAYAYARVAPDAAHALHMPSHIFIAMGLWDDLIASNIDAWNASHARMVRKDLTLKALDFHSLHWLQYGYLQIAQVDSALSIAQRMHRYTEIDSSKKARYHMVFLQSSFLAETGDYTHPIAEISVKMNDLSVVPRAQRHYVEGVAAFQRKDGAVLKTAFETIEKDCRLEALFLDTADFKICADLDREMPRQIDIDLAQVMANQLRAFDAALRGDSVRAENWMKEAFALEQRLDFSFGPPPVRKPSSELYADWLAGQGRYDEAVSYYAKTLERAPGRRLSLEGLSRLNERVASL